MGSMTNKPVDTQGISDFMLQIIPKRGSESGTAMRLLHSNLEPYEKKGLSIEPIK